MNAMPARVESPRPLAGIGVLITRPRAQAESLAARVAALGGNPIIFPVIAILPPRDAAALQDRIERLDEFDMVVFVSPTAVEQAWSRFETSHPGWSVGYRIAAVGAGSARQLRQLGADSVLAPEASAGAQGLLALPALRDQPPKHVLVVRGEGGREELALGLTALGADVEYAECYRRALPEVDASGLIDNWRRDIQAVSVTSVEILENLMAILGESGEPLLRATPVFTHHPRIAEAARAHGIGTVIEAASDEAALIDKLVEHFAGHD
jgi:uroporphyrinogen-III synthase